MAVKGKAPEGGRIDPAVPSTRQRRGAAPEPAPMLTEREIQVLALVVQGLTNKAIAAEILTSEKTVEYHLHNVYAKSGRNSRVTVTVWALQHGLELLTRESPS